MTLILDGQLSTSFTLMGRASIGMELSGVLDSGSLNKALENLKGQKVRLSIEVMP